MTRQYQVVIAFLGLSAFAVCIDLVIRAVISPDAPPIYQVLIGAVDGLIIFWNLREWAEK